MPVSTLLLLVPLVLSIADYCLLSQALYKRSTVPVFKAHGLAQASISDCVSETFSAIRTVSVYDISSHCVVFS